MRRGKRLKRPTGGDKLMRNWRVWVLPAQNVHEQKKSTPLVNLKCGSLYKSPPLPAPRGRASHGAFEPITLIYISLTFFATVDIDILLTRE